MPRWFGRASRRRQEADKPERGLVVASTPERSVREPSASFWARKMRKATNGDHRYDKEALNVAASYPVAREAVAAHAENEGLPPELAELEIRMNVWSVASVPDNQMSRRTRDALMRSAAAGEETYAYPPLHIGISPRDVKWNFWYRDKRVRVEDFETATGGTVDAEQQRRLGGG